MVKTLERFREAVAARRLTHDGSTIFRRHVLNARRRTSRSGVTISKEYPSSSKKIDCAMAAVLAYEARADAVAAGVLARRQKSKSKRLVRF
jgi:phage terminase large subunit-like protein